MRKFKILLALNHAEIAGTEQHVLKLARHINKNLLDVSVVCFSEGPLIEILKKQNIKVWALKRKKKFDFLVARKLFRLIKENKFDLVHSHSGPFACIIGSIAKVPYAIETRHGLSFNFDDMEDLGLFNFLINRLKAALVDLTLTVAKTDKTLLNTKFGVPLQKMRTVPNGVDIKELQHQITNSQILKQNLKIDSNYNIVGTVARFTEQKGLTYLVRSIKHIKEKVPNTKFLIVGDGPLRDYLMDLAKELAVFQDIVFTGYQDNAISFMSIFDIFVLPSLGEGMPYTILEAMALKLPVVTTDVFGNRETVLNGKTGFLVPPRDSSALSAAIIELLMNRGTALQMGKNGFYRVNEFFSARKTTEKIEQVYLELLSSHAKN